jgi:hypothetical protein
MSDALYVAAGAREGRGVSLEGERERRRVEDEDIREQGQGLDV